MAPRGWAHDATKGGMGDQERPDREQRPGHDLSEGGLLQCGELLPVSLDLGKHLENGFHPIALADVEGAADLLREGSCALGRTLTRALKRGGRRIRRSRL